MFICCKLRGGRGGGLVELRAELLLNKSKSMGLMGKGLGFGTWELVDEAEDEAEALAEELEELESLE